MSTYVDIHLLQSVPPSNLNRDDAGSPKQALYGGVRRARVSSQAWKRATRKMLAEAVAETDRSTRTRRIATLLARRLVQANPELDDESAVRLSTTLLEPLGIKTAKKKSEASDPETAYLLFFGRAQLDEIIEAVAPMATTLAKKSSKELQQELPIDVKAVLRRGHPLDVALFGRMVADLPDLNVDAACQVAHAISTHSVEVEFDYFTAVDDEKSRDAGDDAGAAMIGSVEFNSATLYRYATLGIEQLIENIGERDEVVADSVRCFSDAFVRSMPTGHQNSFANRTLPEVVLVTVRSDQPVNLVTAFESPVWSAKGYVAESARRLAAAHLDVVQRWGSPPDFLGCTYRADLASGDSVVENAFGKSLPFPALLDQLADHVKRLDLEPHPLPGAE